MSAHGTDERQDRGQREAYERYLRGMDASMRQKVALTAAHLLCVGKVADMGMGSGAGSEALAALYPELQVVGVDLDATMVDLAREKYRRSNLTFEKGDIAERVFENESLDGIFDSSVLHHVTSYGGYAYENARRALQNQVQALKPHGVLVVRDFLAPEAREVTLDVPTTDGDETDNPRSCSTAALMRLFAREFRSLHATPGCDVREEKSPEAGWARFRMSLRIATEFVLRKDYRQDWEMEIKEEYTYFSQAEFESIFGGEGLRVLASTPLRNPWIVKNRFENKFRIADAETGAPLEWPSTNYLIAGERVRPGEGVRFAEMGSAAPIGFLKMTHYRSSKDGLVRDLVRRPHMTFDVIPHFSHDGDLFVIARMSYPRPILASERASRAIDESQRPHYVTEPLSVIAEDKPLGQTVEEMLNARAKITTGQIRAFREGSTYYPSPGGSQEEVRSVFVEVEPRFVEEELPNASGVSTTGRIRAIEAEQVLRAAQVGGLPDARLELNVYDLFLRLGRAPGPWIGETITLREAAPPRETTTLATLHQRPPRRHFAPVPASESTKFLTLMAGLFEEHDASGRVIATANREYVLPSNLGTNTMACALLLRAKDQVWIGVDDDDLPAAQCFVGNSELLVAPAWRLPKEIAKTSEARAWIAARAVVEYGVSTGAVYELGGRYHPSTGMSPELVFPVAIEVTDAASAKGLVWFPLRDAVGNAVKQVADGHLRVVALRAAHALGLFG